MSQTASILVTGRDMDNKTLRLHEENCVWILDEEESTEQIAAKAVPGYIWKVADYIDSVGTWQGTATELLSAADIEGVLPHQLTRKIVEHFNTVFTPRGIRYETHRTSQARQMKFSHDGNDADDANDAEIDITQLFKWDISQTASSASLASQRSLEGSKHGRSVATGQPAENPTGSARTPVRLLAHEKAQRRNQCPRQRHRETKNDAPLELADRRAMLTCKIAELRKEDKIAEGVIKRIQRTRDSNRIEQENRSQHTNNRNCCRDRSRQR